MVYGLFELLAVLLVVFVLVGVPWLYLKRRRRGRWHSGGSRRSTERRRVMQGSGSGGFGFVIDLGTLAVIGLVVVVVLALES